MIVRTNKGAAVIITANNNDPLNTRIFDPVTRELREKKFVKIRVPGGASATIRSEYHRSTRERFTSKIITLPHR
ncbi:hypothetical protein F7230_07820 [Corynebacterium sp. 320]|nr:hypothetical protein F7230_07820 [Corynebacterium sp. 320]KAB1553337.1 hypothetical protein F7233_01140 [Corynebacterium sp. 321]KAB1554552.1 hypothetical protein F7232_05455 [Corynebacterium sp. 319]KAB3526593.1 hypothetical protein F8354_07820 [Corynebacterium sp. 250]KAB3540826.1 hypothetical protein F8390_00875 [Corynebacterium sp. 366]QNP93305.1 uL14 family ribosomal protein [Corynebacterium zhongnanshanii]